MRFQVHFGLKYVCLVGLAFCVEADKMSILEVLFQHLVVQVVLWIAAVIPSITNVAFLVLLPAVHV